MLGAGSCAPELAPLPWGLSLPSLSSFLFHIELGLKGIPILEGMRAKSSSLTLLDHWTLKQSETFIPQLKRPVDISFGCQWYEFVTLKFESLDLCIGFPSL